MKGRLLLDIVISQSAPVLELLACTCQKSLVREPYVTLKETFYDLHCMREIHKAVFFRNHHNDRPTHLRR